MGYERRKEVLHNAIRGWVSYFKYAYAKENLRAIDEWLRRRIRMCIWKCWKLPRTRVRNLIKCGIPTMTDSLLARGFYCSLRLALLRYLPLPSSPCSHTPIDKPSIAVFRI